MAEVFSKKQKENMRFCPMRMEEERSPEKTIKGKVPGPWRKSGGATAWKKVATRHVYCLDEGGVEVGSTGGKKECS